MAWVGSPRSGRSRRTTSAGISERRSRAIKIYLRSVGSAVVVALRGRLTATASFSPLDHLCGQLNRRPGNTVVLDLSRVERIDCSGIGELVRLHNCAESAGVETRLVNVGRLHHELLGLFRLVEPLHVCSTWRAALRGCDSPLREIGFVWRLPGTPASDGSGRTRRR